MAGTITASIIKNDTTSPPAFQNSAGTEVGTLCRAWVNFNGTTSPGTVRASFNVSSVTKNGTGDYTINFTTAMPDANYAWTCAGSSYLNDSTTNACMVGRTTTSEQIAASLRFDTVRAQGASMDNQDTPLVTVSIFR